MSKIGKKPILLPENVKVEIKENAVEVVAQKVSLHSNSLTTYKL